jgi:hypothetical protein
MRQALADIYSVGTPAWGSTPAPGASALGIDGPRLPGIEWEPRGANTPLGSALAAMGYGIPPATHGHIQLKSHDFISQQYLTPPWGDESEKYIMPDMLCFTLGANRSAASDEAPNATVVLTLAALNGLLDSEWNNFIQEAGGVGPGNKDPMSQKFMGYLKNFGEDMLEAYHVARKCEHTKAAFKTLFEDMRWGGGGGIVGGSGTVFSAEIQYLQDYRRTNGGNNPSGFNITKTENADWKAAIENDKTNKVDGDWAELRFLQNFRRTNGDGYPPADNPEWFAAIAEDKKQGRGSTLTIGSSGGSPGSGSNITFEALEDYYEMATKDFYCWLTRFGILSRVNFCGSVMNVNRGTSLEGYTDVRSTQHYTQVVVGIAKRVRVANVFGEHDNIDTGSQVWLALKRKAHMYNAGEVGAYCVVPGGSMKGWPTAFERTYNDPSGRPMIGWVWRLGVVLTPPTSFSTQSVCQRAANLGYRVNEREAYEYHGTLPTMYVAFGYSL